MGNALRRSARTATRCGSAVLCEGLVPPGAPGTGVAAPGDASLPAAPLPGGVRQLHHVSAPALTRSFAWGAPSRKSRGSNCECVPGVGGGGPVRHSVLPTPTGCWAQPPPQRFPFRATQPPARAALGPDTGHGAVASWPPGDPLTGPGKGHGPSPRRSLTLPGNFGGACAATGLGHVALPCSGNCPALTLHPELLPFSFPSGKITHGGRGRTTAACYRAARGL